MKPAKLTLAILNVLKPETNKQQASVGKQNRTNQSSSLSKDQGGVRKLHSWGTTTSTLLYSPTVIMADYESW